MNFENLRFRLRAKGRHGTHSPFVYAFVEHVLRSKEVFENCPQVFSAKSWQRLNATLKYLKVDELLFPQSFSDEVKKALSGNWPQVRMSVFGPEGPPGVANALLLLRPGDDLLQFADDQKMDSNGLFSIYLVRPHHSDWISSNIESLKNNPGFKMVLDFWQGLLLVRSNDFKEKQFFKLK